MDKINRRWLGDGRDVKRERRSGRASVAKRNSGAATNSIAYALTVPERMKRVKTDIILLLSLILIHLNKKL